jgi:hypothetical protein
MHDTPTRKPIADRLGEFPEAWRPEPGEKLVGVVVELGDRDGGFGDYPVVAVLGEDGEEYAVHAFHTVLRNEVAKQRPAVGDRIGIAYHGKDAAKGYEKYRVIVEKANPAEKPQPDWDRHAAEAQAELGEEPPPLDDDEPY